MESKIPENKKKELLLLIFLVLLFIILNYSFISRNLEKILSTYEYATIQRVIDADTVIINNQSVRLLGINAPEK